MFYRENLSGSTREMHTNKTYDNTLNHRDVISLAMMLLLKNYKINRPWLMGGEWDLKM